MGENACGETSNQMSEYTRAESEDSIHTTNNNFHEQLTVKNFTMIKKRGLAGYILLSIITFGIYALYWNYKLAKDVNLMCEGDGKKTRGLLACIFFGIITMGIYNLVWLYMLGDRLQDNGPKYGITIKESGGTILLWSILGSFIIVGPFIACHILIKNTNALADEYNKRLHL
jgi:protein-S-isoprenylcysteine O-methyltransferase Ste14